MSYYVKRIRKSSTWGLFETYFEQVENQSVRKQPAMPKVAWRALGINKDYSIEEARTRASQLSQERSQEKAEKRKLVRAARNFENRERVSSVFVPSDVAMEFEASLADNFLSLQKSNAKLLSPWTRAQKLLVDLRLQAPSSFKMNRTRLLISGTCTGLAENSFLIWRSNRPRLTTRQSSR